MIKKITATKGDNEDTIDSLIDYLEEAKKKGATHYMMSWSRDPIWSFKWFETYRLKSEEEIKQEKIDDLEKQLKELKDDKN